MLTIQEIRSHDLNSEAFRRANRFAPDEDTVARSLVTGYLNALEHNQDHWRPYLKKNLEDSAYYVRTSFRFKFIRPALVKQCKHFDGLSNATHADLIQSRLEELIVALNR